MVWKPHVTVAAVLNNEGKYLFVHETSEDGPVLNQPAGHLEDNETLLDAVRREVAEETAYEFVPEYLVGIYQYRLPAGDKTYLRFCFTGQISGQRNIALDPDIIETLWLSREELDHQDICLRSPLVNRSLDDYERGQRLPIDLIHTIR
ncbi:MAG: NUDIX hydrolase [Gammaproteobacteria bacterium]|nr:NUDIX hydrolase [Gammaproteobacteria bacterium]